MIYWTDVAASHRLSTLKTAEEEEDIWVGAFDLHPVAFMYTSRPSERHERRRPWSADRAVVCAPHTRGLKKYQNSTSVPWDRTSNS
jgi:hypothetical protein